jgi:squalene synthase HpnC
MWALDPRTVTARVGGENFPVASRVLPRQTRAHLLALYGFARLVDELGDSAAAGATAGERLEALDQLEADLDRAYRGQARHPLLVRLQPTLRECALPREPFARLIEANRVDQRVHRYETWEQLRDYCALSANPVGELVLGVFGQANPARVSLSDAICTALQLVEHCQDVAEDRDRGRVYLPAEDLARCGCTISDLSSEHAGEPLRAVLAFEVRRARDLLTQGAPLIDELHGIRERLAVAAFVAGGRAALDAIERAACDVLAGPPRAGTRRRLLALGGTLLERRR